jgi:ppGpp synthetase/RelA/SpoT-type nucleotidyltranferase
MKIPASIRTLYADQLEVNRQLQGKVDARIRSFKSDTWHYESRLKQDQSFALKVESGRAPKPSAVEDVFACTLVVRNGTEIDDAEKLIHDNFLTVERRPKDSKRTHKSPDQFHFDDLRLYVQWKEDPDLPPSGIAGVTFEVQIKTFLQHAWAIATHDLVYKTDNVSWGKQRIAFQIKAMLEHAELSIQEAELLAESSALAKTDNNTRVLQDYMVLLTSEWNVPDLPTDIRRLAENVKGLMELMKLRVNQLKTALDAERGRGRGPLTQNLSPYGIVLQTLMTEFPAEFKNALTLPETWRQQKIVIPAELPLPGDIDKSLCANAIFL